MKYDIASLYPNEYARSELQQHYILNNHYGNGKQELHGGRYSESYSDSLPDFVKLAEAYGVKGLRAQKPSELEGVIKKCT